MLPRLFWLIGCVALGLACASLPPSWSWDLGQQYITFPTSTKNPKAQEHFINALGFFHNFIFPRARAEFQKAQEEDPMFAMAYWGEAQAYKMGIWFMEYPAEANAVLDRMKSHPGILDNITKREKMYIEAITAQYVPGVPQAQRDANYRDLMRAVHEEFPTDEDAACLYSLAEVSIAAPGDWGYSKRAAPIVSKVNATLRAVLAKNKYLSCANHYLVHALDAPAWARDGVEAGQNYALGAPSSWHASHMVTHLLKHLGQWEAAAIYNQRAVKISREFAQFGDKTIMTEDWHSHNFLHYILLQQGRSISSLYKFQEMSMIYATTNNTDHGIRYYLMLGNQVVETRDWNSPLVRTLPDFLTCPDCEDPLNTDDHFQWSFQGNMAVAYAGGVAAIERSDNATAAQALDRLYYIANKTAPYFHSTSEAAYIAADVVHARLLWRLGRTADALDMLAAAVEREIKLGSPSYEPPLYPPAYETYAEVLIDQGKHKEAFDALSDTVIFGDRPNPADAENEKTYGLRDYNRATTILLKAKAALGMGSTSEAHRLYSLFQRQWAGAETSRDTPYDAYPYTIETAASVKQWLAQNAAGGDDECYSKSAMVGASAAAGVFALVAAVATAAWCRARQKGPKGGYTGLRA